MSAILYRGRVEHARHAPVRHAFSYPVLFCGLDLARLQELNGLWPVVGHNRPALLAVRDRDHLQPGAAPLLVKLHALLADRPLLPRVARVELFTVPRVLGYGYSPVNFYLCTDHEGGLVCAVAEVNNTYGETHLYVLDGPDAGGELRAAKELFVSPFFDLRGEYRFRFDRPAPDEIDFQVRLLRGEAPALTARLWGRGRPFTRGAALAALLRQPLSGALTMPRIAWQARRLRRLGLVGLLKPRPTSPMTVRPARPPRPNGASPA